MEGEMKLKWKLSVKHSKDCYAVNTVKEGIWEHPWAYVEKECLFLKKNGAKKGNNIFHYLRCNCTTCPARALFSVDDLVRVMA